MLESVYMQMYPPYIVEMPRWFGDHRETLIRACEPEPNISVACLHHPTALAGLKSLSHKEALLLQPSCLMQRLQISPTNKLHLFNCNPGVFN